MCYHAFSNQDLAWALDTYSVKNGVLNKFPGKRHSHSYYLHYRDINCSVLVIVLSCIVTCTKQSGIFVGHQSIDENSHTREWYIENTAYVLQLATPYYEELTVLENLRFSAVLKVSGREHVFERPEYIDDILKLVS